ncbi:MAG TPA: hypothetical protein VN687_11410 [Blastocatellia bacterium]|nr:hypothetical protein [Blastocatellia bacterium]
MLRKSLIAVCVTLLMSGLITGAAPAQVRASAPATGYEMYSWKLKGHWYYSLSPLGAARTYSDITTNPTICRDSSGLKARLSKLPGTKEIIWMSDAPTGALKPAASSTPSIKHPSRKRIKQIRAICSKLGIRLKLA